MATEQELLYFNGINGETGEYDLPPMSPEQFLEIIRGENVSGDLNEIRHRGQSAKQVSFGIQGGVDINSLDQAGWGVIFAAEADRSVEEALAELIDLRTQKAGSRFRIFNGPEGYHPGESVNDFLARRGVGPGPADPDKVPYYLLIVGGPDKIPFDFQLGLGGRYAVGRLDLNSHEEYANYARSVVAAETGQVKLARQAALFGVANNDDRATAISAQYLVNPLKEQLQKEVSDWRTTAYLGEKATKQQLADLLGGDQAPALLFAAGHGLVFHGSDPRHQPHQGALLCQDWPGSFNFSGSIPQDFYFAGDDLSNDANLLGLIAFFFASYGLGTPAENGLAAQALKSRSDSSPYSSSARLPSRMLGLPKGGALAVIGQVDRAWGYSFHQYDPGWQTEGYFQVAKRLLHGDPVGLAMENFKGGYAELSFRLSEQLEKLQYGAPSRPEELVGLWTAWNDAQNFAILGDPAVRLPVARESDTLIARPNLEIVVKEEVTAGDKTTTIAGDDLTQIRGIGPRYQEVLHKAGISTFTRLAVTTKERLSQIFQEQNLRASSSQIDGWLEEAAALAHIQPRRTPLFFDEQPGPKIYMCQTDRQWDLAIDGLVLPLSADGGFGGFANALLEHLSARDRRKLKNDISTLISSDFGFKNPVIIPLAENYAAQLLPNRPKGADQEYFLIAATTGGAEKITDLRLAAYTIVMKAAAAGVHRLGIVPIGSGTGMFQGQARDVGSQMAHGIWAARLDLESSTLAEVTFAPTEAEAVQAAKDKARLLTRNRPQEVLGDQPAAIDLLGIKDEAEALAETLLLRKVKPPISVAILGGWGSGKSTVMRLMMQRMTRARTARIRKGWPDVVGKEDEDEEDPTLSTRVGHIYQIRFNAWTYAKSNLWASLMQTIFWELNRQLTAEQELFEHEKKRGPNGRSPLYGGDEFQFLYDEYGWDKPKLWNDLDQAKRAALQPDAAQNILWQQLRAKQQVVLQKLQQKETRIAQLRALREQTEAERKKEVTQQLNQESQTVAYHFLRRKSQALLGDLYQDTEKQVNLNSTRALANQLAERLGDIADQAGASLADFPATGPDELRTLLQQLSDLKPESGAKPSDLQADKLDEYVTDLRAKLTEAERIAGQAAQLAVGADQQIDDELGAILTELRRQAQMAANLTGTVESVEEMFTNLHSINTTAKHVRTTIAKNPKTSLTFGSLGLALLLAPIVLFTLNPGIFDHLTAQLAGFASLILSAAAVFGPTVKVAGDWSRRVNGLFSEYQAEADAQRQRFQALVESSLAAALAADEQALQESLSKGTVEGQRPTAEALLKSTDQANLAAIDYRLKQLQLEAEELRRQAGPPGEYESLLDFVQARQDEQVYEKKLGLMHQVKRDIDVLTGGLVIQPQDDLEVRQAKRDLFPRGPARVILYIDDLDRCPPGRVVEVLEAVQLLLNTELFVVVLGLDTRYITRALEKEYKEILQPDGDPSGLDYIEKILQLPYRVRPIGKSGMARFLKEQMQVVVPDEDQGQSASGDGAGGASRATPSAAGTPGQPGTASDGSQTGTSGEPGVSEKAKTTDKIDSATADEAGRQLASGESGTGPEDGSGEGGQQANEAGAGELDEVPPEVIRFQPEDLEDLTACCQLLKLTPRNVKRMVNVLKLIDVFWFRTAGDLRGRQVKSTVMGLLALSAAYPEIMREVFDKMDVSYRSQQTTGQVGEFLNVNSLPSNKRWCEQYEPLIERFESDVATLYDPKRPEQSLIGVNLAALEEDTFNLVRSFSFVGDPVYLRGDDDGGNGRSGPPETPLS